MTEWLACSGEARCFTLSSTIIKCTLQTHSFRPTVTQAAAFDVSLRRSHFWRGSLSYHLIHVSNTLQPDTATILSNLTYGRQPLYYYPVTGYPQVCSFPWPSCLSYLTDRLDQKLPGDLGRFPVYKRSRCIRVKNWLNIFLSFNTIDFSVCKLTLAVILKTWYIVGDDYF